MASRNFLVFLVLIVQIYHIQGQRCYDTFNDYCRCRARRNEVMVEYEQYYKEYETNSFRINESLSEFQPWVNQRSPTAEAVLGKDYRDDLVDYRSVILRRCGCRPFILNLYPIWIREPKRLRDPCSWILVNGPRLCRHIQLQSNFWTCTYREYFQIIFVRIWEVYNGGLMC